MKPYIIFLMALMLFIAPSCKRQARLALSADEHYLKKENFLIPLDEEPIIESHQEVLEKKTNKRQQKAGLSSDSNEELSRERLDFSVQNNTGRSIYVACFSYIKKRLIGRWRWDKSKIYSIKHGETVTIDVDDIPDDQDRKNVYGYLGVFHSEQEADDATYELTDERKLLDLDSLINLQGKKVTIEIETYGFKGESLEYDFVKKNKKKTQVPRELDFVVDNQTGKTVHIVGFIYEKKAKGSWFGALDEKDDMAVWRYDKTLILTLQENEQGYVDVDTLYQGRDREYVRGFLGVFDEHERALAEKSTYELLEPWRKLHLERLTKLANKKIVLTIEEYGINEDFIDYVIKDTQSAMKKLERTHEAGNS